MDYIKQFVTHDIALRAAKTFVQATLAAILAGLAGVNSLGGAKALAIGAVAAGISAVWNSLYAIKRA